MAINCSMRSAKLCCISAAMIDLYSVIPYVGLVIIICSRFSCLVFAWRFLGFDELANLSVRLPVGL